MRTATLTSAFIVLSTGCGGDASSTADEAGGSTSSATSSSTTETPGSTSGPSDGSTTDADPSGSSSTSGTDGEDESTGNTPVGYDIAPPVWLRGMWSGEATDGTPKLAIVNEADISFGDLDDNNVQLDVTSFASFPMFDPDATFEVHTENDTTYSYTLRFVAPDGPVEFTDTFELVGDDTVEYTFELGGMVVDSFSMDHVAAAEFLRPPAWLQGRWEGISTKGVEKVAVLGPQSVGFGDIIDGKDDITDFGFLLGLDPSSTFRVETAADSLSSNYRYTFTFVSPESGMTIEFVDEYAQSDPNSLNYTFEMGGMVVDTFPMALVVE